MINRRYPIIEFYGVNDIWEVAIKLFQEYKDDLSFSDAAYSVSKQIPIFACKNMLVNPTYIKDLNRYLYCKEMNVSPYEGSYDKQPVKWIEKYYIIQGILNKLESVQIKKANKG